MKNIYKFILFSLLFTTGTQYANGARPDYLATAGDAWTRTLDGFGRGGDISDQMRTAKNSDFAAFLNMVDVVAYNDSAMNLYHISGHLNNAMGFLDFPDMGRRPSGKTLSITTGGFADFDDYESDYNSDFKSNAFGFFVRASGYIGGGFALGVGYTNSHADTKHSPIDTTIESNSITIFTEYMNQGGMFLNMGINGGSTRWQINKTIANIPDDDVYNTDFYAAQITTGVQMGRTTFAITPHMGLRYTRTSADRHTDAATQTFDKWWYNLMTANAGLAMQYAFVAGGAIITPSIHVGGTYDIISNGTDDIRVTLGGGQIYDIPVDTPHRAAFIGSVGININAARFTVDVEYSMDARSDYISHNGRIGAKFTF